jgi:hypothetical protein
MTIKLRAAIVVCAIVGPAIAAFAACEPDQPPCYVGDYRECNCPNVGAPAQPFVGYQGCLPNQTGYYACVCTGNPPTAPLAFGTGAFLSPCTTDSQCAGGYCSSFKCTMPCQVDSDCPPLPSTPAPSPAATDAGDEAGDASDEGGNAGDDDAGSDASAAGPPACTPQGLCRTK